MTLVAYRHAVKRGSPTSWLFQDNTISYIHCDLDVLQQILIEESMLVIQWFEENFMKANPDKFQAICIGKKTHDALHQFQIDSTVIKCEDNVTLLGVNIDFNLDFRF